MAEVVIPLRWPDEAEPGAALRIRSLDGYEFGLLAHPTGEITRERDHVIVGRWVPEKD